MLKVKTNNNRSLYNNQVTEKYLIILLKLLNFY